MSSRAARADARVMAARTIRARSVPSPPPRLGRVAFLRLILYQFKSSKGRGATEGDYLTLLGLAFGLSLTIALILYIVGRLMAEKGTKTEAELSPYACGEAVPPVRPKMDMSRFFVYLLLFLAFDVATPIIALAVLGHYVQAALYLAVILLAILTPAFYLRELMGRE